MSAPIIAAITGFINNSQPPPTHDSRELSPMPTTPPITLAIIVFFILFLAAMYFFLFLTGVNALSGKGICAYYSTVHIFLCQGSRKNSIFC